ncbi:PD40 domain-containing protein [Adhaeribacter sp. BT258]|uniref:PD40 domain-containing protein n=1 Tax=Adhaeribacter terrigena TaxID=2793070 RepID=A0ABS1BZ16_9BACT|nr:DPP IV N-terminal domain-containing protein [Adhaeribacter terrigena]MBK0402157.1 PD40 domain-containing protein [Adhaeribacter terrigena]
MKLKLRTRLFLPFLVAGSALLFSGCSNDDDTAVEPEPAPASTWSGKLIHDWSSSIREYNFATKVDPELFEGQMPYRMPNGNTLHIGGVFERLEMTNANGVQRTVIYNSKETSAVYSPQLSPDGTKIAFSHLKYYDPSDYPVKKGTVIIDLQGNYVAGIPDMYNAVWLPDGRLVVAGDFSSNGAAPSNPSAKAGLHIATITGTTATLTNINPTLSNPSPLLPSVSPDGKRIAFILNKHLWTINTDGTNLKQLTASDNDNEESFSTWSPDGKYIAVWSFKSFEISYYTAIAVVPADAAQALVLTNEAAIWPRDQQGYRISGGRGNISWR